MSLRTVPGMINVKTPIGSAVAEFNRSRATQMPKVKEGWAMGAAAPTTQVNDKGSMPKAEVKVEVPQKDNGSKDPLPISNTKCSCKTKPKESYGPRAEVRGQNPYSIYSGNAPHVVEGWRAKNTRKTVKAIVIVLIIVVVIMLVACMLMKMMKPKHPVIFSRYVNLNALTSSPPTPIIKYPDVPEVPMVDGTLLFGGKKDKKAKKSSRGKSLGKKGKGEKKVIRKLNEVYSADDEELI